MNDQKSAGHNDPKNFHISVNGREKEIPGPTISYEEVVRLANLDPATGIFVVTYSGPGIPDNTLAQGGRPVQLKNGMKFDVLSANRS